MSEHPGKGFFDSLRELVHASKIHKLKYALKYNGRKYTVSIEKGDTLTGKPKKLRPARRKEMRTRPGNP